MKHEAGSRKQERGVSCFMPLVSCFFVVTLWVPAFVWAAGPILVDTTQTGDAVVWQNGAVTYSVETGTEGTLGRLSNQEARDLVTDLFQAWADITISDGQDLISTVSLTIEEGTGLGSVDESNLDDHFTYCPATAICPTTDPPFVVGSAQTGISPILFDDDGTLTDLIQGSGASNDILGFAGPRVVNRTGSELFITESQAVLNGVFIDCFDDASSSDSCQSPEVSLESFKAVVFHELGHFLGLDHTQVNLDSLSAALGGDVTAQAHMTTMLPLLLGEFQLSPHFDDKVSISTLYPASAFLTNFCTISGTVFLSDGATPMQGANVIARRTDNPQIEATSFVSGSFYTGTADCTAEEGDFQLRGILPGAHYTLEIEPISASFTSGSSIEPCDPPNRDFAAAVATGTFSCSSGGQTITSGSSESTDFVTSKAVSQDDGGDDNADGGDPTSDSPAAGCNLLPLTRLQGRR